MPSGVLTQAKLTKLADERTKCMALCRRGLRLYVLACGCFRRPWRPALAGTHVGGKRLRSWGSSRGPWGLCLSLWSSPARPARRRQHVPLSGRAAPEHIQAERPMTEVKLNWPPGFRVTATGMGEAVLVDAQGTI